MIIFVTVIGLLTAFFALTRHGLWGDEVWSASWSQQQSWPQTFSRFLSPPDLPLNFLLVQASTTFGQGEFWVRLPSALLGAATCPVLFLLGRRVYGTPTGVCAAIVLAVAPYHVWYAQDARPYAPLALYALLSLYFFYRLLERPSVSIATGFMVATTLDLYNHLFGLFPLIVELLVAIPWAMVRWTHVRRGRFSSVERPLGPKVSRRKLAQSQQREQRRQWTTYRFTLVALGGATVAALLACLPLYSGIAQYVRNAGPSEVPEPAFVLTPRFVTDLFAAFGSGTGWPFWLLAILFAFAIAGDLLQRRWFVGLGLAWLVIPLAMVALGRPHHLVGPRYFLFLQPVFVLFIARGLVYPATALDRVRARFLPSFQEAWRVPIFASLLAFLTAGMVVVVVPPTWQSYRVERTNDWSDVCSYLHDHAAKGATVTGNVWGPSALFWCFRQRSGDRPDVAVVAPSNATFRGDTWYFLIGPPAAGDFFDPRRWTAVPHSVWARPGLEPDTAYDDRLTYPQSEVPGVLYHYRKHR